MRTTVQLDDDLPQAARVFAAKHRRTFTSVVEEGVRLVLSRDAAPRGRRVELPISSAGGGVQPGVDLDDTSALLDIIDGTR